MTVPSGLALIREMSAATEHLNTLIPTIRVVFTMFFAMLGAVPITWFIFWSIHREPDWGYQQ